MAITGFIEHFLIRLPILYLFNAVDSISDSGRIIYGSTSWQIMGLDRMFGIMAGGPNQFGVFNGIAVAFLFCIKLSPQLSTLYKSKNTLINITLMLSIVGLLFSLSRAGMAIAGLSVIIMVLFYRSSYIPRYIVFFTFLAFLLYLCLSLFSPEIIEVIVQSLLGKESSASDRGNNVLRAFSFLANNPLGYGLGTTDIRGVQSNQNIYFAESSYLNLAIEIGMVGLSLYFTLLAYLILKTKKVSNAFKNVVISVTIPIVIISFFSVNTHQMPSLYIWWIILGLGLNKSLNFK
jgi:hypothetical protein